MKTILYNKFDKKEIANLPRAFFPGKIIVILNEAEADKAVDYLLAQDILGIDTETRPVFKKGHHHKVALLQVCDRKVCFLFRLNIIGIPPSVIRLLEDTTIPKIGLSLTDDMLMLHHRAKFEPGNFIDLQNIVEQFGIEDKSLQKLYANIFGERIVKREQLSNWENQVLTDKQKIYGATDAWTCIRIYERLQELKSNGNYELVKIDETDNEQEK